MCEGRFLRDVPRSQFWPLAEPISRTRVLTAGERPSALPRADSSKTCYSQGLSDARFQGGKTTVPISSKKSGSAVFCSFLGSTNASKKGTNGQVLIL